mmetsp:Transcript_3706/g.7923  ORF Transcript_3706/g.7923 Transcript_3706/m.7923 type:complete len:294 (-) Transcript_3706:1222-2103(-)
MFFQEEPSIPIPIVWPYPGDEVFVTGDFNSFALQEMHGDKEKCTVIWAPPARIHFRFLVDGTYLHDGSRQHDFMDGKPYNFIDVAPVPIELKFLKGMSIAELERLDYDLFCTRSISLSEQDPYEEQPTSPTKHHTVTLSQRSTSISSSIELVRFTVKAKAAITIQKFVRRFLAQRRYLTEKDAALHIQRACRHYISSQLKRLKARRSQTEEIENLRRRVATLESTCEMWAREAKKWKSLAESYKTKVGATLGRSATSIGLCKENSLTTRATYVHAGPRNSLPSMKVKPSCLSR